MQNTLPEVITAALSEEEYARNLRRHWAWITAGKIVGFIGDGKSKWFYKRKMLTTLFILELIKD